MSRNVETGTYQYVAPHTEDAVSAYKQEIYCLRAELSKVKDSQERLTYLLEKSQLDTAYWKKRCTRND
jgi:hypothetical protein